MNVYAVLGDPIFHTLSPLIHRTLYEIYDIDAVYLPIQLGKHNVVDFLENYAPALDLQGCNVTMPLKGEVMPALRHLDDISAFLQSVNTIDLKSMSGYTTDGLGFLHSINTLLRGKRVVLIGAGGAAKSIAFTIDRQVPGRLVIANRTLDKAQALSDSLQYATPASLEELPSYMGDCDVLINATSCGMGCRQFADLSFVDGLPDAALVQDIVYNPRETALLRRAKQRGLRAQNGIDMLIWQAFYAFEIFFGIMPTEEDAKIVLEKIEQYDAGKGKK